MGDTSYPSWPVTIVTALIAAGILAVLYWLNADLTTSSNVTCKQQQTVAGKVEYLLCLTGQSRPVVVPRTAWEATRVGGYYDEATRTGYRSANDDPHVSHGLTGGDGEGHGAGEGAHGGGGE